MVLRRPANLSGRQILVPHLDLSNQKVGDWAYTASFEHILQLMHGKALNPPFFFFFYQLRHLSLKSLMSKLGFNSKSLSGFKVWNIARRISSAFPPDNCLVSSLWFRVVSSKKAGLSKENSVLIAFKILPSPPYSSYLHLHDLWANMENIESGGLSSKLAPWLPLKTKHLQTNQLILLLPSL